jgi:rare lipoprotein A
VEELNAPGAHAAVAPPHIQEASSYQPPAPRPVTGELVEGHMKKGKFLPNQVVSEEAVRPTGLFVQAGSFGVFANAENLTKKLAKIGQTTIDPVTVGGRKLYRVKVGPIASVAQADHVLEKVISIAGGGAKVIKN